MEFIKAEEFLGQPVEVQKVFIDWWKDKKEDTDLVKIELYHGPEIKTYERIKSCNLMLGLEFYPLFTEGQLRRFVEDKTGCVLNVEHENYQNGKWDFYFTIYKYKTGGTTQEIKSHMVYDCDSLIDGYWKVALGIAKEAKAE